MTWILPAAYPPVVLSNLSEPGTIIGSIVASVGSVVALLTPVYLAWKKSQTKKEADEEHRKLARREADRLHEKEMADKYEALIVKVEAIESESRSAMKELAKDFRSTVELMMREMRDESRAYSNTLLSIQRDSAEVTAKLATKVGELGMAIGELRKAVDEREDHPGRPRRPRSGG